MKDFLESLRAKPRHVKSNIAFLGALVITLAIASVWSISLPARFSAITSMETDESESESTDPASGAPQLDFTKMIDDFRSQLGTVRESDSEAGSDAVREELLPPPNVTTIEGGDNPTPTLSASASPDVHGTKTDKETSANAPQQTILIATTTMQN